MSERLSTEEIDEALTNLDGWSIDARGDCITKTFEFPSFPEGIHFVDLVAEDAEARNHHPDIDIRWTAIRVELSTHAAGGVSELDLDAARQIDGIATRMS